MIDRRALISLGFIESWSLNGYVPMIRKVSESVKLGSSSAIGFGVLGSTTSGHSTSMISGVQDSDSGCIAVQSLRLEKSSGSRYGGRIVTLAWLPASISTQWNVPEVSQLRAR